MQSGNHGGHATSVRTESVSTFSQECETVGSMFGYSYYITSRMDPWEIDCEGAGMDLLRTGTHKPNLKDRNTQT